MHLPWKSSITTRTINASSVDRRQGSAPFCELLPCEMAGSLCDPAKHVKSRSSHADRAQERGILSRKRHLNSLLGWNTNGNVGLQVPFSNDPMKLSKYFTQRTSATTGNARLRQPSCPQPQPCQPHCVVSRSSIQLLTAPLILKREDPVPQCRGSSLINIMALGRTSPSPSVPQTKLVG